METAWKAGLEDVIAARSAICRVDGEAGRLYYRGYEIGDLARAVSFEDVTALLWFGELPSTAEAVAFAARLRAARGLPTPVKALLERPPPDTHPLDPPRTAVPHAGGRRGDGALAGPRRRRRHGGRARGAARDRRPRVRRGVRGAAARGVGGALAARARRPEGAGARLRPPRLQGRRCPCPGAARDGGIHGGGHRSAAALRRGRARVRRDARTHGAPRERGILLR